MGMSLTMVHTVRQGIRISGGASRSLFSGVESWLRMDDHEEVIQGLAEKASMDYRSLVDLVFCEIFTEYRAACRAYYEGTGKPLRKLLKRSELHLYQSVMLYALSMAYVRAKEGKFWGWDYLMSRSRSELLRKASKRRLSMAA